MVQVAPFQHISVILAKTQENGQHISSTGFSPAHHCHKLMINLKYYNSYNYT